MPFAVSTKRRRNSVSARAALRSPGDICFIAIQGSSESNGRVVRSVWYWYMVLLWAWAIIRPPAALASSIVSRSVFHAPGSFASLKTPRVTGRPEFSARFLRRVLNSADKSRGSGCPARNLEHA